MATFGVATNKKLLDLFNDMKAGSLSLRPSFQRKLVWNDKHKENFIQTILFNYPFPEIYLADGEIDLKTQKSKTLVVDGQQRLSTIYQYVVGSKEFSVKRIKRFQDLTPKEQTDFFDYKIVVRDLGRITDELIIEIFKRINSVNYALNAIEIQNALYEGEFISTAKTIVERDKFLSNIEVFSESELSRMRDVEFILLVMATIEEGGYFSRTKEVETYVKKFDEKYESRDQTISDIESVLALVAECKLPFDSLWFRKSSFFTLMTELVMFKRRTGLLPNAKSLASMLLEFEANLLKHKNDDPNKNEFAGYYYYTFQGTTGRTGRVLRGKLLEKYIHTLK